MLKTCSLTRADSDGQIQESWVFPPSRSFKQTQYEYNQIQDSFLSAFGTCLTNGPPNTEDDKNNAPFNPALVSPIRDHYFLVSLYFVHYVPFILIPCPC